MSGGHGYIAKQKAASHCGRVLANIRWGKRVKTSSAAFKGELKSKSKKMRSDVWKRVLRKKAITKANSRGKVARIRATSTTTKAPVKQRKSSRSNRGIPSTRLIEEME